MKRFFITRNALVLPLFGLLLLAGCKKKSEAPHYPFTTAQLEWSKPYQLNAVWEFTDNNGHFRRYISTSYDQREVGIGNAKLTDIAFYRELAAGTLTRTDSTITITDSNDPRIRKFYATMAMGAEIDAANRINNEVFEVNVLWSNTLLVVPARAQMNGEALPTNWKLLPSATFGNETFTNVLEYTPPTPVAGTPLYPWDAVKVYYVANRGVVSFTERGGTTWDRY